MKKYISFLLVIVLAFSFTGCTAQSRVANTKIDIGKSEIFSEEDRKSAADWILNKWSKEKARYKLLAFCVQNTITELYSITYAGDEKSKYEQQYYADVEGYSHEEIIVFYIDFHTARGAGSEGFEGDEDYEEWAQILGRDNAGKWVFVTEGY